VGKLTERQKRFAIEYVDCMNATQAAIRAGYSKDSARRWGYALLQNSTIQAEIARIMRETRMTEDELVARLTKMATASYEDFLSFDGYYPRVDLHKAREAGALLAVRKLKFHPSGTVSEVELHDARHTLMHLAKIYGMLHDKLSIDITLVQRVAEAVENAGGDAAELFNAMIAELQAAHVDAE
jgi:phage terminase small subunit